MRRRPATGELVLAPRDAYDKARLANGTWGGRLAVRPPAPGADGSFPSDPLTVDEYFRIWRVASNGKAVECTLECARSNTGPNSSDEARAIRNAFCGGSAGTLPLWRMAEMAREMRNSGAAGSHRDRTTTSVPYHAEQGKAAGHALCGTFCMDKNTHPYHRVYNCLLAMGGLSVTDFVVLKKRLRADFKARKAQMEGIEQSVPALWEYILSGPSARDKVGLKVDPASALASARTDPLTAGDAQTDAMRAARTSNPANGANADDLKGRLMVALRAVRRQERGRKAPTRRRGARPARKGQRQVDGAGRAAAPGAAGARRGRRGVRARLGRGGPQV